MATTDRQQRAPVIAPPTQRGLPREVAAAYIGVGPTKFDQLVRDGRMPKPKRIDGRVIWDVRALDVASGLRAGPYRDRKLKPSMTPETVRQQVQHRGSRWAMPRWMLAQGIAETDEPILYLIHNARPRFTARIVPKVPVLDCEMTADLATAPTMECLRCHLCEVAWWDEVPAGNDLFLLLAEASTATDELLQGLHPTYEYWLMPHQTADAGDTSD